MSEGDPESRSAACPERGRDDLGHFRDHEDGQADVSELELTDDRGADRRRGSRRFGWFDRRAEVRGERRSAGTDASRRLTALDAVASGDPGAAAYAQSQGEWLLVPIEFKPEEIGFGTVNRAPVQ